MTKDFAQCPSCQMQIDLNSQDIKEVKACNWCGDRTFLLNLTTEQASTLYKINPQSLGGRIRANAKQTN